MICSILYACPYISMVIFCTINYSLFWKSHNYITYNSKIVTVMYRNINETIIEKHRIYTVITSAIRETLAYLLIINNLVCIFSLHKDNSSSKWNIISEATRAMLSTEALTRFTIHCLRPRTLYWMKHIWNYNTHILMNSWNMEDFPTL